MALRITYNPLSGQFDYVSDTTPAPGSSDYQIERFTLTGTDITNKYIILASAPSVFSETRLVPIGGVEQDYGVAYEMLALDSNKRLSWNGLELESILATGDKLVIVYKT